MKALITGGAGFIGSHLAERLLGDGSKVVVVDDLSTGSLKNIEAFKKTKATRIITHCAGCYRTLKLDYKELLPEFDMEVLHITELIQELLEKGELKFSKEVPGKVTYHDPCHLGRHSEIYDPPRYIINNVPGVEFIEMNRVRENSWCCGAGGGVKSGFSNLALEIAKVRIEEAVEIGASVLTTTCPFCLRNLEDGNEDLSLDQSLEVIDLLDLVLLALGE